MGQKVSPVGLRIGITRDWNSRWYANDNDFASLLHEDIKIREFLYAKLKSDEELKTANIANIEIERTKNKVTIFIHTSRPGVIIGKEGKKVDDLRKEITKMVKADKVFINIVEIKNPDLNAQLVANKIAEQLENRASFRIVQKRAIQSTMRAGAKGIKTCVSGRLGGAEMARKEGYSEGNVPLHTLRADIDYAVAEAHTTYGKLGVKVWICRGEVLPTKKKGDK
ncbi:MAG: 30S ribosomal protein S3 [Erysipelotrichaceae bacterium]|nr:30S ribosomal protein S3 [Erysipelotrichaceae bacterium]